MLPLPRCTSQQFCVVSKVGFSVSKICKSLHPLSNSGIYEPFISPQWKLFCSFTFAQMPFFRCFLFVKSRGHIYCQICASLSRRSQLCSYLIHGCFKAKILHFSPKDPTPKQPGTGLQSHLINVSNFLVDSLFLGCIECIENLNFRKLRRRRLKKHWGGITR